MIGVERVAATIKAAVERTPHARNPYVRQDPIAVWCLYTAKRDPNRHCIAGQAWADLDLPVPGPEFLGGVSDVLFDESFPGPKANQFTKGAQDLLTVAQDCFDGTRSTPLRWDKGLAGLIERLESMPSRARWAKEALKVLR